MRYAFIQHERIHHPVWLLCRVMRVSRSGFYAWRGRPKSKRARRDDVLTEKIKAIHVQSRNTYGAPRIHAELREQGVRCGKKRVGRLMRLAGLQGKVKGSARAKRSKGNRPATNDLLQGDFSAAKPDTVWFSDLTYLPTCEGWLYLAVVLDAFSRRVVSWAMKERLTTALTLDAFEMARQQRQPAPGLILPNDRGSQYLSDTFQRALQAAGVRPSLSSTCLDNAVAESFFATLKTEEVQAKPYETRSQARSCIFDYLEVFYNRQRRHTSLGCLSPANFEEKAANLNRVSIEAGWVQF